MAFLYRQKIVMFKACLKMSPRTRGWVSFSFLAVIRPEFLCPCGANRAGQRGRYGLAWVEASVLGAELD